MKNLRFFLLCLGCLLAPTANATLNIFACEPEWASLAQTIGGDRVKVFSATSGKQDPHHIEARPSLIARTRRADLLFCTGAELEIGWLPLLIRKAGNSNILPNSRGYLMAADHLALLDKPQSIDRSRGDVHASGNPHVHMNPHNILKIAEVLTDRLQQLDEDHRDGYAKSLATFDQQWRKAIEDWEQQAQAIRGKVFVVNHKSWVYLADWLKLDMSTTLEPYPGVPPTAEHLSRVLEVCRQKEVQGIVYSSHSNPRAANWLAERSNIPVVELPYTVGGSEQAKDLFSLFDETIRLLKG
jgi:zinc/manganese transport system substrate-binding protein